MTTLIVCFLVFESSISSSRRTITPSIIARTYPLCRSDSNISEKVPFFSLTNGAMIISLAPSGIRNTSSIMSEADIEEIGFPHS